MSFKQAAILAPVSFFLGVLFICFNVDHRVLWGIVDDEVIKDGFQFYTTFFNAPPAIKALLHGMFVVGLLGLVAKLHKWNESAVFFDGTSLAAYVFGVVVYLSVTINALRTIVTPTEEDTQEDRVSALSVLSAGNVIMIGCFTFILLLQAGQEWALRAEQQALAALEAKKKQDATTVSAEKKTQ
ncbi:Shr3 amino acid permease chaperone [Crepidotus variabilis]|uniref:Shr3 amino acid permease chaperone n=1 Tax=Crepidotus variabilis TaxID=179855 RepID=A0A9P6JJA3_9AGAR|nr:Shr3 amino acid permease chaperone [Crepidotus variabilis]